MKITGAEGREHAWKYRHMPRVMRRTNEREIKETVPLEQKINGEPSIRSLLMARRRSITKMLQRCSLFSFSEQKTSSSLRT